MSTKRPQHEIRLGRIKATIWKNDGERGAFFNVNIVRLYKNGDTWKTTTAFGRDDLPLVSKVADLAHTWIYETASSGSRE